MTLLAASALLALLAGPPQAAGGLRVRPEHTLEMFTSEGASAELTGSRLELVNRDTQKVDWRASSDVPWLAASPARGSLRLRERTTLELRIAPERADALTPGIHEARLKLVNLTSGQGGASITVRLHVRATRGLKLERVSFAEGADGESVVRYAVENEGRASLRWRAQTADFWLQVQPRGGTLEPGERVDVRLSVTPRGRERLGSARRRTGVAFVNATDGAGTTLDVVELRGGAFGAPDAEPPELERARSVSRFGITWTFDRPYPVGRFANGDWWVRGPCLVISVEPPVEQVGGRTTNGSMINPMPRAGMTQGYDSAMYGKYASEDAYDPKLNVARDLGWTRPLVLAAPRSLVSTISEDEAGARPQLQTAAILTALAGPVPEGSFRPPYSGADKQVAHHVEVLRTDLLAALEPVPSTPPWGQVESRFERPWLDHVVGWYGRYVHPALNMPDYGRDMTHEVSTAALMLHLDVPLERKRKLLVSFVQLGIDLFGILRAGGSWPPSAGHLNGRKWPILFAGLMLDDPRMAGIGAEFGPEVFSEDGQTFYVPPSHRRYGYRDEHIGLPEWSASHATRPELDDPRWLTDDPIARLPGVRPEVVALRTKNVNYRLCCTANAWWGQILAARIMGAVELWNHPALFDYQDRYFETTPARGVKDYRLSWQPFYLDMWRKYRARY